MNISFLFDYLLSQSNGDTFYFDDRNCPISLLKEAILRGFQVMNYNPILEGCISEDHAWSMRVHAAYATFGQLLLTLEGSGLGLGFYESCFREGFGNSVSSGDGVGNGSLGDCDSKRFRWGEEDEPPYDTEGNLWYWKDYSNNIIGVFHL